MLGLTLEIAIVLALVGLNGVLAMSEIAVVSSRKIRLQQNAENGDAGAAAALAIAQEPTRFLSTVQIGITFVGIVAGAFGGAQIADRVALWLEDAGISNGLSGTLAVALVVLVIAYVTLVFGELVPKRIGLHRPERTAAIIARPMQLLARAGGPFVASLSLSTSVAVRFLGIRGDEDEAVTEEELRLMIGLSAASGDVEEAEAALLDRVFHFGDRRVHAVMTPRTEAVGLPMETTVAEFYRVYAATPHSRFPLFDGSPDTVTGILVIKDVLAALSRGTIDESSRVAALARPAFFVPESKPASDLLREMQARRIQMAIAVDEFGGTAGIITVEQILEEMVGPVHDELLPREKEVQEIDERTLQVDGGISIEEAREALSLAIQEGPYDTIAGYVLERLGHIPEEGERLTLEGGLFTVLEMKGAKIELLRFTRA